VYIKSDKGIYGNYGTRKTESKNPCYRFVIGFLNFTRLSDSTCADNAEHFSFAHLVKRLRFGLPLVSPATKRANWIPFPNPIKEDRDPIGSGSLNPTTL